MGDSKLVSYTNLAAMVKAEVDFIAPASKTYVDAATLAAQNLDTATAVDYVADRDRHKDRDARGIYKVAEDTMVLTGANKADPALKLRRVFRVDRAGPVHDPGNVEAPAELGDHRQRTEGLLHARGAIVDACSHHGGLLDPSACHPLF